MPVAIVQLWEGRTVDQKRRLTKAITDAMIEHAECNPSGLHVVIQEYPRENWARAGVLGIDRQDADAHADPAPQVFGLGHLLLQVRDLEAAKRFYLDFLGLRILREDVFRNGEPLIVTEQGIGLTPGTPETAGAVEHIALRARRIEKIAAAARERSIPIVRGPEPSNYGTSLYLADPDGNTIEVFGDA
jgi:4-oxalocrotonate tautomerase